jgi:4-amino-4-deoxy-L-arabinose transferase-like glycosyltransferase
MPAATRGRRVRSSALAHGRARTGHSSRNTSKRVLSGLPRPTTAFAITLLCIVATGTTVLTLSPIPHVGGDETSYVGLALSIAKYGTYTELYSPSQPPHVQYPPLFPLLLASLILLGARTWSALKVVALISTVLAVTVTFFWGQRRLGWTWALGASLALAVAPAVLYHGHWILSDATFLLLTLLALYSLERSDVSAQFSRDEPRGRAWLIIGLVSSGLAYLTRAAGLPLLTAVGAWLLLRRRSRALGLFGLTAGLPIVLWSLRDWKLGQHGYLDEFWLVNPYDPSQGQLTVADLVHRVNTNLLAYMTDHVPSGLSGLTGFSGALLGVTLAALSFGGWVLAVRNRIGPVELFLPLYVGLVLLWPEVWSGARFALPLYPLILVYVAQFFRTLDHKGKVASSVLGFAGLTILVVPAIRTLAESRAEAASCANRVAVNVEATRGL